MPDKFFGYITDKLMALGWQVTAKASSNLFTSIRLKPSNTMQPFSVIYLKNRIDTDGLSYLFQNIPDHLLIVADSSLIGEDTGNKEWFRALHALFYGRVYVWDGLGILPLHYDRVTGKFSNGGYVTLKSLRFERVDCLYSGFKGQYNVVLLNDRKFWTTGEKPPSRENTTNPNEQFWQDAYAASSEGQQAGQSQEPFSGYDQNGYARQPPPKTDKQKAKKDAEDWRASRKEEHFRREQAQRDEQRRRAEEDRKKRDQEREREDVFRDFREAFERNKSRYGSERGGAYDPNAQPQYARGGVTGDKWFMQIWSDGTINGAKKVYRALARQYHPDVNKEPDAIQVMQAINLAYEKAMRLHNG